MHPSTGIDRPARAPARREKSGALSGKGIPSAPPTAGSFAGADLFEGPPRVLLAEEDSDLRRWLATTLADEMIEVIEVVDGAHLHKLLRAAFELRACEPPRVIVCPRHLPGADGESVLAWVRQLGRPTCVVLVMDEGDEDEATPAGVAVLLRRPLAAEAFVDLVRSLAHRAAVTRWDAAPPPPPPPTVEARLPRSVAEELVTLW